ncbi:MAG: hypothetical protein P4M11_13045 [Candidatus Pacebacteria bacterium]|nr:hypothetical protein [Candidatus Paceibacterota bacterium]
MTAITIDTEGLKFDIAGQDSLLLPQAKQVITFKEERNEYEVMEAYSISYDMQIGRLEGQLSMKMYQWVLSFVEMGLAIKVKTKIKALLVGMLISDYNATQTSEESRIREVQEDTEVNVEASTLSLGILSSKASEMFNLQANRFRFNMHDDLSICAYTVNVDALALLATQHRKLSVLKLKQFVFLDSTNKSLRKHTSTALRYNWGTNSRPSGGRGQRETIYPDVLRGL